MQVPAAASGEVRFAVPAGTGVGGLLAQAAMLIANPSTATVVRKRWRNIVSSLADRVHMWKRNLSPLAHVCILLRSGECNIDADQR